MADRAESIRAAMSAAGNDNPHPARIVAALQAEHRTAADIFAGLVTDWREPVEDAVAGFRPSTPPTPLDRDAQRQAWVDAITPEPAPAPVSPPAPPTPIPTAPEAGIGTNPYRDRPRRSLGIGPVAPPGLYGPPPFPTDLQRTTQR